MYIIYIYTYIHIYIYIHTYIYIYIYMYVYHGLYDISHDPFMEHHNGPTESNGPQRMITTLRSNVFHCAKVGV